MGLVPQKELDEAGAQGRRRSIRDSLYILVLLLLFCFSVFLIIGFETTNAELFWAGWALGVGAVVCLWRACTIDLVVRDYREREIIHNTRLFDELARRAEQANQSEAPEDSD